MFRYIYLFTWNWNIAWSTNYLRFIVICSVRVCCYRNQWWFIKLCRSCSCRYGWAFTQQGYLRRSLGHWQCRYNLDSIDWSYCHVCSVTSFSPISSWTLAWKQTIVLCQWHTFTAVQTCAWIHFAIVQLFITQETSPASLTITFLQSTNESEKCCKHYLF